MDIRKNKEIEKLKKFKFDILVNNAGLGRGFEKIHKTKANDIDTTIDTNVKAFLQLLRCIIPSMVKKKGTYYQYWFNCWFISSIKLCLWGF